MIKPKHLTTSGVDILTYYRKMLWPEVKKYLVEPKHQKYFSVPPKYIDDQQYHWKIVKDYPLRRGKYFRPTILLLTAMAIGAGIKRAINTAVAMQISEEWLLVHDDFEDNSIERRGEKTLHRIYGNELSINAGDTLQTIMWKVIVDNKNYLDTKTTDKIANEFYQILTRTELGQTVEIRWTKENRTNFGDCDWFFVADGKTSYYTIAGPMRLGAIIAKADTKKLDKLAKFGLYLGRCYQLIDDILDLTSDFAGLKKQRGNDIYEGKRTVILGHLLRSASPEDKKRLLKILAKSRDQKNKKEVNWILEKMKQYDSIEYAKKIATKYRNKAYDYFEKELGFLSREPARSELKTLIHFVLERDH